MLREKNLTIWSLMLVILIGLVGSAPGQIYVDAGATGANNGSSWDDAYIDLQDALDAFLENHPDADIDYIHGDDSVRELVGASADRLGFILPDLEKSTFFRRITDIGPYPRKTFSIGEAVEKRYYLEARRLEP